MDTRMLPANIWLLQLTDQVVSSLKPVTSLDIYDGSTANFHEDGLYSVSIFGRVGTEERDKRFSYIDMKASVLHPKIYRDLVRLKSLYGEILSGRSTARFDPEARDFVSDKGPDAETGYSFFMRHFHDLEFKRNKSNSRNMRIDFIEKYRSQATTSRLAVIPAGLRDLEVSESGRKTKHEINDMYYKVLSISNTIARNRDMESSALDIPRYSLTLAFLEIYSTLEDMIEGKKGFMLNKWASRRIMHGTRNVLSIMETSAPSLDAPNAPSYDSTVLGLFQVIKALTPITIHLLRTRYLANVFSEYDAQVPLIDKRTLLPEMVSISPETRDTWTTREGLLSVINSYNDKEARHRPVVIEGRYLALVYKGKDTFKVFYDIRELPEGFSRKDVSPITLCELLYLSGYDRWNSYYTQVTRYPITGIDSIYPSRIYTKTTINGEVRYELDYNWQRNSTAKPALEFPKRELNAFLDSQSPHSSRLKGLGADFDGDTGSSTTIMTDEALEENRKYLASRKAWVSPDGRLRASASYDTIELVVLNMTGR